LTRAARLKATFHEKIWGSTHLEPWFPNSKSKIGEVWFTADKQLPVLVKFLFTSENLSVQVHPDGPGGKTEMWHILRAEPGARIALGFREPVTRAQLRESTVSGEIEDLLQWFPVKAGETYFTPARTVHAIGGGVALCEIQQYSDITYRLYDYGRPRELHLEAAIGIADLGVHPGPSKAVVMSAGRQSLVCCEYFETELHEVAGPEYPIAGEGSPLLIFLEGSGSIAGEAFQAGEVWQVPDNAPPVVIRSNTAVRILRVGIPNA